jgi:dipeptidyl aminopeptidase/acylaminoacyl peptidase
MVKSDSEASRALTRRRVLVSGLAGCLGNVAAAASRHARAQEGAGQSGKKIVFPGRIFVSVFGTDRDGVLAIDPNAGTWKNVSVAPSNTTRVSPDGRAMICPPGTPIEAPKLWLRGVDAGRLPVLVDESKSVRFAMVSWGPAGREFLVSLASDPNDFSKFETWKYGADGKRKEKLPIPSTDFVVDWSADGRWLLSFSARAPWNDPRVDRFAFRPTYLLRADGSEERLLIEGADDLKAVPPASATRGQRFSPDGQSVSFIRMRRKRLDEGPIMVQSLFLVGVDGKEMRCLVEGTPHLSRTAACWAPDGKWLAVSSQKKHPDAPLVQTPLADVTSVVEIFDLDGKRRLELPTLAAPMMPVLDWR